MADLLAVSIDRTRLNTFLASFAVLMTVALAVLVTHEVCCTVLLTVATVAVLIALLFGSDCHLLASAQLWVKNNVKISITVNFLLTDTYARRTPL